MFCHLVDETILPLIISTSNHINLRYTDAYMQHTNWDNLRYVLVLAKNGSVAAAARELSVNRTTVLRRIDAFQKDIGCRIFERGKSGYVLTVEAEKIIDAANEVESVIFNIQRQVEGHELRLEGELRVTTTDTLMVSKLGPHLVDFHRKYPHITVIVSITNSILDLTRRDADVAIRPTKIPDPPLVGNRLSEVRFGVYASQDYLRETGEISLGDHQWLGFDGGMQSTAPALWLDSQFPKAKICFKSDTFVGLKIAAENGMGLALLPHYLGDSSPHLKRLPAPTEELTTGLWLLTHPDLVRSARVNAFMDHFIGALTDDSTDRA